MLVVGGHPALAGRDQLERTGPFLEPQALAFQGAHDTRGVRMPLGVVIAGRGVLVPQARMNALAVS